MFDRRSVVKSLLALGSGRPAATLPSPEDGPEFAKTAPIKVARINGVWTIIPLGEMRAALEARFSARRVDTSLLMC